MLQAHLHHVHERLRPNGLDALAHLIHRQNLRRGLASVAGRVLLSGLLQCFRPQASQSHPCKHRLKTERTQRAATAERARGQITPKQGALKSPSEPKGKFHSYVDPARAGSGQGRALTTRESLIICTTTMWSFGFTRPTLELMLTASCSSVSPAHHPTTISHHFCR